MHALQGPRPSLQAFGMLPCSGHASLSGKQQPCMCRPQRRRHQHTWKASEAAAASSAPDQEPASTSDAAPDSPEQQTQQAAAKPAGKMPAHAVVSEALNNVSITIVGDDTALNWAICQALSKKLGWFPVSTAKVLAGMLKVEQRNLTQAKSSQELADLEADMLRGMRNQYRCCVATLGDGAAARPDYTNLWGTVIIWVDEVDRRHPKPPSPAREAYAQAEVRAAVEVPTGFGSKTMTVDDKAQKAVGQLVTAIGKLLQQYPSLPEHKRAYITLGCRGDWPELQPPDWNPVLEAFGRRGGSLVGSSGLDADGSSA